jgi:hypothetical protein
VPLTTTRSGSLIYGVGNDWNGDVSRTLGTGQTMVHEFLNPGNDTFWVQRLTDPVPAAGTTVTLNDTAPTDHIWNFAAVEILPLPAPTITWSTPADIIYGTALGAAQLNATTTVAGSFVYTPPATTVLSAGAAQTLSVTFTPTDGANYTTATKAVAITVLKVTPAVSWNAPADITYGTALSAAQLNASSSVPGTFVYSPAAGTVLGAGARTLSATFTPTDTAIYNTTTSTVAITVMKAAPLVTWPTPAAIAVGTALSAAQLNATANVPGTFVYTPPGGTVLGVGAGQSLSAVFTPTETANYNAATASVSIDVGGVIADFNGDGTADALSYNAATGDWAMKITGTSTVVTGAFSWPIGLTLQVTELDGNGLADIFGFRSLTGDWVQAVSAGVSGFTSTTGRWWAGWQASLLDIDGHGQYGVFLDNGGGLMTPLSTGIPGEPQTRPWLSADRLRLYFGSARASVTSVDVLMASRSAVASDFGTPAAIAALSLPGSSAAGPSLTSDELTIVFESDRAGGVGGFDLWSATRASLAAPFSAPVRLSTVSSTARDAGAEIAADGRTLYFESDRAGGLGGTDIWVAVRQTVGAAFSAPVNFAAINSSGTDSHPALSTAAQDLYFSSDRSVVAATGNIWRARLHCDGVTAAAASVASSGGPVTITIVDDATQHQVNGVPSSCAWVATTTDSWITITSPRSGLGPGVLILTAAANSGGMRIGRVNVGGQTVTITQAAAPAPSSGPGPTPPPPPPPAPAPQASAPAPDPAPAPALGGPRNLRASVQGSTVALNWDAAETDDPPFTYVVEAGSRPGAADLASLTTNDVQRAFTAFNVAPGTYLVRVRATGHRRGTTGPSNEVVVVVGSGGSRGCQAAPPPPSGLRYSLSGSTVTLTWAAPGGLVSSYILAAGSAPQGIDAAYADTGNTFTRFVAAGVPRGTYYVRIHAKNACGMGGSSNEIAVVVP